MRRLLSLLVVLALTTTTFLPAYAVTTDTDTDTDTDTTTATTTTTSTTTGTTDTSTTGTTTTASSATIKLEAEAAAKSVILEWQLTGTAPDGFKIVRSKENTEPAYPILAGDSFLSISSPRAKSYIDKDIRPDTTYHYRVCAYDQTADECTTYSNAITVTTRTLVGRGDEREDKLSSDDNNDDNRDDKERKEKKEHNKDRKAKKKERHLRKIAKDKIKELKIDEKRECGDFERSDDDNNELDDFERTLCRAKKLREYFNDDDKNDKQVDCETWDANGDNEVDDADVRTCKVQQARAKKSSTAIKVDQTKKLRAKIKKALRPVVLDIRWGNLDSSTAGTVANTDYTGNLTIIGGKAKILHPIMFEERDGITSQAGTTVGWQSTTGNGFDGVLVQITPDQPQFDAAGALTSQHLVTLTLGDYVQTWQPSGGTGASGFFGQHAIGNDHQIKIRNIINLDKVPTGVSTAVTNKLIASKSVVSQKLAKVYDRLGDLQANGTLTETTLANFEKFQTKVNDYNFYGRALDKVTKRLKEFLEDIEDGDTDNSEVAQQIHKFNKKFDDYKGASSRSKFQAGLVPFRDVDDTKWYEPAVTYAKDNGIVSGYGGDRAGDYGPADPVTVAEVLKMSLRAADHLEADTEDSRYRGHWAAKFFETARELGLSYGLDDTIKPDSPATRGDVASLVLETLGILPPAITVAPFSDVALDHPDAAAIAYLKELAVISGDSTGDTYRPDDSINRAETAKIIRNMIEILKVQL